MKYQLKCLKTGDLIDDNYTLHYTDNALLRAVYREPFSLQGDAQGLWKYLSWIPTSKANEYHAGTVTYKADALGEALGLSNLWVSFHGYWPEKGGFSEGFPRLARNAHAHVWNAQRLNAAWRAELEATKARGEAAAA